MFATNLFGATPTDAVSLSSERIRCLICRPIRAVVLESNPAEAGSRPAWLFLWIIRSICG